MTLRSIVGTSFIALICGFGGAVAGLAMFGHDFAQTGPRGPRGIQGAPGPTGPTGPAGTGLDQLSGLYVLSDNYPGSTCPFPNYESRTVLSGTYGGLYGQTKVDGQLSLCPIP